MLSTRSESSENAAYRTQAISNERGSYGPGTQPVSPARGIDRSACVWPRSANMRSRVQSKMAHTPIQARKHWNLKAKGQARATLSSLHFLRISFDKSQKQHTQAGAPYSAHWPLWKGPFHMDPVPGLYRVSGANGHESLARQGRANREKRNTCPEVKGGGAPSSAQARLETLRRILSVKRNPVPGLSVQAQFHEIPAARYAKRPEAS